MRVILPYFQALFRPPFFSLSRIYKMIRLMVVHLNPIKSVLRAEVEFKFYFCVLKEGDIILSWKPIPKDRAMDILGDVDEVIVLENRNMSEWLVDYLVDSYGHTSS